MSSPLHRRLSRPLLLAALCAATLSAAGCNKPKPAEPPPAAAGRPLVDDGSVARGVTTTLDRVKVQTDLTAVRGAIQIFKAEHEGKLPASLEECGVRGLHYAEDYRYDPEAGTVSSETYPSL